MVSKGTRPWSVWPLAVCLVSIAACGTTQRLNAADRAARQPMLTWLKLELGGGMPPLRESLTIAADGRASVLLRTTRHNGYVGTFEYQIPSSVLACLKRAVREANFRSMPDEYRPPVGAVDFTSARIRVRDELGIKRVRVTSASRRYPRALKSLIDLTKDLPGSGNGLPAPAGLLSEIISEASARPVAAISVRTEAGGRPFRVGEDINVDIVIRNVGRQSVVLPSLECKEIARGFIWVRLFHDPPGAEDSVLGLDSAVIEYGSRSAGYQANMNDRARADLSHVVRIGAGEEWRIRMPKPLVALCAGNYEVTADFRVANLYDRAALERELGNTFIDCWIDVRPARLTVRE